MKRLNSTDILVLQVLEELQLTICSFRQHWGREWFHDLLDRDALAGKLVFGRAVFQCQ
jgi:hypothetical protein